MVPNTKRGRLIAKTVKPNVQRRTSAAKNTCATRNFCGGGLTHGFSQCGADDTDDNNQEVASFGYPEMRF